MFQLKEVRKAPHAYLVEEYYRYRKQQCRDYEVEMCLVCLKHKEKVYVSGAE